MRGRKKIDRKLSIRPIFTEFGAIGNPQKETIVLTHDELEAIKLADLEELYHEECAKELDVSRTTFSRIIKSARRKVALMLLFGKKIKIELEEKPFTLLYPSNDRITIADNTILATYFVVCEIEQLEIRNMRFINNPIAENLKKSNTQLPQNHDDKNLEANKILPPLFDGINVAMFVKIENDLKQHIEEIGISVVVTKEHNAEKAISKAFRSS